MPPHLLTDGRVYAIHPHYYIAMVWRAIIAMSHNAVFSAANILIGSSGWSSIIHHPHRIGPYRAMISSHPAGKMDDHRMLKSLGIIFLEYVPHKKSL
jgi:hypothetical protein